MKSLRAGILHASVLRGALLESTLAVTVFFSITSPLLDANACALNQLLKIGLVLASCRPSVLK